MVPAGATWKLSTDGRMTSAASPSSTGGVASTADIQRWDDTLDSLAKSAKVSLKGVVQTVRGMHFVNASGLRSPYEPHRPQLLQRL